MGHSIAADIHGTVTIIKMRIADGRIFPMSSNLVNIQEVRPDGPGIGETHRDLPVAVSPEEQEGLKKIRIAFGMKGSLSFWNGFETSHKDFCLITSEIQFMDKSGRIGAGYSGGIGDCDNFRSQISNIIKIRDDWAKR
jgi:hypothetical protein